MKLNHQSKQELRKSLKFARSRVVKKADKDNYILNTFVNSSLYRDSKQILMYMALDDEINVDALLDLSRINGKSIAVPYCVDNDGNMDFYYINSLDDLVEGSFGVREPNIKICKKVSDYNDSVILVPAIAFDKRGFRLGYGKGYYDRFLSNYPFISVGLCYNSLIQKELPINEYDQSVDYIITDTSIIDVRKGENDG